MFWSYFCFKFWCLCIICFVLCLVCICVWVLFIRLLFGGECFFIVLFLFCLLKCNVFFFFYLYWYWKVMVVVIMFKSCESGMRFLRIYWYEGDYCWFVFFCLEFIGIFFGVMYIILNIKRYGLLLIFFFYIVKFFILVFYVGWFFC